MSVFIPIPKKCYKCWLLSRARLFATPWTAAHQAPLSTRFSRRGYWSGLPFPSPISKKVNAKECSNYCKIALISHATKVMLRILQDRLQQYMNCELPDVQVGFLKGRGSRDQVANICWIIEKARKFQKNIYFCLIDCAKAFDCVDHSKLWEILQEMGIPDHLTCLLRNLYAGQEATVRTGHGTTDWLVANRKRSPSRLYVVTLLI